MFGKNDEAIKVADQIEEIEKDNSYAYNIRGLTYINKGKCEEGIKALDNAIKYYKDGEKYEDAYVNKALALYTQNSFSECIEYCNSIKDLFPDNSDICYYEGESYSELEMHDKAITCFIKLSELLPHDSYVPCAVGWEYYALEDYDNASKYLNMSLKIDKNYIGAKALEKSISDAKKPEAQRIVNFIRDNYLYLDKVKDFEKKAAEFIKKKEVSQYDIFEFLESIRLESDNFTFFIPEEYYVLEKEEEESNKIENKILDKNIQYLRINSFTEGIDRDFEKALQDVENSKDQTLVIDLRGNPGGLSDTANNILDFLLPDCVTSYMVDRKGEIYTYYSDEEKKEFKHIYVFIDEESASSSELLALGLRTYLNNVTIIGRPSFGKGVGQNVFENKKKKYMLYVVQCYWNIKEKNISDHKIQPDIIVEGNELSDYMEKMNQE